MKQYLHLISLTLFKLVAWPIGLLVIIWYPLHWWPIIQPGFVMLGDVLAPWLVLLLWPLLIIALIANQRYLGWFMIGCIALIATIIIPSFWSSATPMPEGKQPLTIMSFNLWYNNPQQNVSAIADLIQQETPDILLLQEVDTDLVTALTVKLETLYEDQSFHTIVDDETLQAVISRYPLTLISAEAEQSRLLKVRTKTAQGDIQIWNIHAFRVNFLPGNNLLSYGTMQSAHQKYEGQLGWLIESLAPITEPLILGGDLNIPDQSADYRALNQYLRSTHQQAGEGLAFTFPATSNHGRHSTIFGYPIRLASPIRVVRLDYIFVSSHFQVESAHTLGDSAGSDHAPIVGQIWW